MNIEFKHTLFIMFVIILALGWYQEHKDYLRLVNEFYSYTVDIKEICKNNKIILEKIKNYEENLQYEKEIQWSNGNR